MRPTRINNEPEITLILPIDFGEEIKFLTLERNNIKIIFPNIGTENDITEITNKSIFPIFVKSKNPGNKVR